MRADYQLLHNDMLADIERCMRLELPEKEKAEKCFWIARHYVEKLEKAVKETGFADEAAEIDFFKQVKPLFGSYIEYFIILAEALQFEPAFVAKPPDVAGIVNTSAWLQINLKNIADYWEREGKRFERFCQKNQIFVEYITRGETRNDALYFLRENDLGAERPGSRQFNTDPGFSTFHEQVMRSYLAHKRYDEYCRHKIKEIIL